MWVATIRIGQVSCDLCGRPAWRSISRRWKNLPFPKDTCNRCDEHEDALRRWMVLTVKSALAKIRAEWEPYDERIAKGTIYHYEPSVEIKPGRLSRLERARGRGPNRDYS